MQSLTIYQKRIRALLSPAQRRVLGKLSTPKRVQDFLDTFPIKVQRAGEPLIQSPLNALKTRKLHCMDGAVLAALALGYHGRPPLLLDLRSAAHDYDHVLALFKENNLWGAISKTNHPVLRWRDPVYRDVRELAMSYFHEYFLWQKHGKKLSGKKTMRAYSKPFDLRRYAPARWVTAGAIDWLAEVLDSSHHFPIASKL